MLKSQLLTGLAIIYCAQIEVTWRALNRLNEQRRMNSRVLDNMVSGFDAMFPHQCQPAIFHLVQHMKAYFKTQSDARSDVFTIHW